MDVHELTEELVGIPSHDDESEVGDFIEEWLRSETDADVSRDEVGNVFGRYGTGDEIALIGHHDVVPPDAAQVEDGEYVVYQEGDRLVGRGTADMKGAVAAMMVAFRDGGPIDGCVFASFVGEETGGRGARVAIDNGFAPAQAIVGEGSTSYSADGIVDVAVAHKGRRGSTITVTGEAAHASEEAQGENAIYRACEVIGELRSLSVPQTDVMGENIQGSLVVTEISGGSAWNIVPEECSITIDERTVPGDRAAIEEVSAPEWVAWTVDQDLPPMACRDSGFVERVHQCVNSVTGGSELIIKPHATDAGWLSGAGVSCLICGPAEPGEAHTATESVRLSVLTDCYEIYRAVIEQVDGP